MTGFKSFPEKTVMHMNGSITGVVGPNGSGKSNVSDAIRWVLGEQSPKALRGSVMQDVIFAGTQTRKPRSFCEVSLIFDNSESKMNSAYSEIQVTRKLYSSGESEYYLNNTKCRLKDILGMFRDTGIGKEGYSIIGQGKIDEILSERSLDRRRVFEEASGIMKYRVRKEEAERKLEKTRFNLIRINDILLEQKLLLGPLKKQSDDTLAYLNLTDRLKHLEINMFLHNYDNGKGRIERYRQTKQSLIDERMQKEAQLEKTVSLQSVQQENTKLLEHEGDEISRVLSVSLAEIERVEGEIRLCEERIANIEKDSTRIEMEITEAEGKEAALSENEEYNIKRLKKIDNELEGLFAVINETSESISNLSNNFTDRVKAIEAAQSDKLETVERMADVRSAESVLKEKESHIQLQIDEANSRLGDLGNQQKVYEESKTKLKDEFSLSEQKNSKLRETYNGKVLNLNSISGLIAEIQQELETSKREHATSVSSAKLLGDMKSSFEGYQDSVRRLMIAARDNGDLSGRIIGTFADLIDVPQKYEAAIESCLGAALQDIIVADEYDAKHLISYLRKNDMGRATFLPLKALEPRVLSAQERNQLGGSGVCGAADEIISFGDNIKKAAQFLLGRTVIVEDSDTAIRIMRENHYSFRTVTLEGDVFNPGGAITGGSTRRDMSGLVSRDRREDELLKRGSQLVEKVKKLESAIQAKKHEHDLLMSEIESLRHDLHENEVARSAGREKLAALTTSIAEMTDSIADLRCQIEVFNGELVSARDKLRLYEALRSDIMLCSEAKSEDYKRQESEYIKSAAVIEEKKQLLHDAQIKTAEMQKEKAALESDNSRLINEKKETVRSKATKKKMIELNAESAENLVKLKVELEILHKQKNDVADGIKSRQADLYKKKGEMSQAIVTRDEKLGQLRQGLSEISEKTIRTEFNIEKAETLIQEAQNKLWDTYALTYANVLPQREEINVAEAQTEIEDIKQKIREIGGVNPNAIEDYNELKERMETLTEQKDDLAGAEEDLHKLITSLLDEMEKTFKTSFNQINKYFNQTFQELFDGGSARLLLENEQDIMESGIEIIAEPPGKKLQKISLLSGGEKALTAICLLFALLKINPSPVCVLDEIDAALDESNVYKFSEYLKKYARKMQFIVITHKKPTMVVCDSLYGFAMEEKGVSKLLSVRLD